MRPFDKPGGYFWTKPFNSIDFLNRELLVDSVSKGVSHMSNPLRRLDMWDTPLDWWDTLEFMHVLHVTIEGYVCPTI